jgi:hypothetical protein
LVDASCVLHCGQNIVTVLWFAITLWVGSKFGADDVAEICDRLGLGFWLELEFGSDGIDGVDMV